jgi:multidrug resistance efflux pump
VGEIGAASEDPLGHVGRAFLSAAAVSGDYYWKTGRFLISTDDAYVQAHSVLISPKVSGYISEVPVDDNDMVEANRCLAGSARSGQRGARPAAGMEHQAELNLSYTTITAPVDGTVGRVGQYVQAGTS